MTEEVLMREAYWGFGVPKKTPIKAMQEHIILSMFVEEYIDDMAVEYAEELKGILDAPWLNVIAGVTDICDREKAAQRAGYEFCCWYLEKGE